MGLFDRLEAKNRPTLPYPIRVDDTSDAAQVVSDAQSELLFCLGTEREDTARERLKAARADLAACFEKLVLTALPPTQFETLIAKHPPRPDTDDEAWNTETLPRAAFLACVPEGRDEQWWTSWLESKCSDAEQTALFNAAVAVNVRLISETLPKGWTEIPS